MKSRRDYGLFLKRRWLLVLLGLGLNLAFAIVSTISADYLRRITDALGALGAHGGGTPDGLTPLIAVGGGLAFLAYAARWLGAIVPMHLAELFSYETRIKAFRRLTRMPFARYEMLESGRLQSVIQSDGKKAGQALYTVLSRILNNVFLFICSVWLMAKTDAGATAAVVLIVLAATAVNQLILRRMKKHNAAAQQCLAEMTGCLEKAFSGMETVKAAGAAGFVLKNYQDAQKAQCDNKLKATVVGTVRTLWFGVTEHLCLYGSVLWLGMLGVGGSLTVGEALMFIYLIKRIIMPIEVAFRWMASMPDSAASWERVEGILQEAEESKCEEGLPAGVRKLDYRGIRYAYSNGAAALSGVSLSLERGKAIGLAGASGSGKTTLLKIAAGLYDGSAEIFADGRRVGGVSVEDVAYAALENGIFPMSVYDNVALGNPAISRGRVLEALERLGASDWISSLENGIDAQVSDSSLSGGQKQSVVNARAIVSGRKILIMDEPFSALDTAREQKLTAALRDEKADFITLIASHRALDGTLADGTVSL